MTRIIAHKQAAPDEQPLSLAIYGPSFSGKTMSSIKLARGICRAWGVAPKDNIFMIDTENRRGLQYAETFNCEYQHVEFNPPFGSLDYLDHIDYCVAQGARVIIIDSGTHEHSGIGGLLERQEEYLDNKSKGDSEKRDKLRKASWISVKAERKRFEQRVLQIRTSCAIIICYRADRALDYKSSGREAMQDLGFKAETTSKLPYEMAARFLLYPMSCGVPTLQTNYKYEKDMIKLPIWCADWFEPGVRLDEEMGERFAKWAKGTKINGTTKTAPPADSIPAPANVIELLRQEWRHLRDEWQLKDQVLADELKRLGCDNPARATVSQRRQAIDAIRAKLEPPAREPGDEPDESFNGDELFP